MSFLFAALLTPLALAEDPGLDADELALPDAGSLERDGVFDYDPPVGETIIVTDQAEVKRRQRAVIERLGDLGYEKKRGRDGRTVYVSDTPWEPRIIVDDDGWMVMKRRPIVLTDPDLPEDWWFSDTPLEYLACVVAPQLCVRIGGLVISKTKLDHKKSAVANSTAEQMSAWGDALADKALSDRLYKELPEELDRIWYDGLTPAGQALAGPSERRARIMALWLDRTDNKWGDAARVAIEAYMEFVIQASEHPYTAAEIEAANARRTCRRALVLPVSLPSP